MSRSGQCGQHGQEQRWCRHGGRADALKGAVMWHLGRAGGAAGPGGWGGGRGAVGSGVGLQPASPDTGEGMLGRRRKDR